MRVGCWDQTKELEQVWLVGSLGIPRKRVGSAIRMHSKVTERGLGWPLHRILGLEQVSLLVGHMVIGGRQLKEYHSLCLTVWLISRVRLEDTCTEGMRNTYGQRAWREDPLPISSFVLRRGLSSRGRRRGLGHENWCPCPREHA
jgi:hypothetical protein